MLKWGWEFTSDGSPWVAHLVCPIPNPPNIGDFSKSSASIANLPLNFLISNSFPVLTATPAESYPLYSNLESPSTKTSVACLCPKYPTIPHILNSS